jgi:hypothetical protein
MLRQHLGSAGASSAVFGALPKTYTDACVLHALDRVARGARVPQKTPPNEL